LILLSATLLVFGIASLGDFGESNYFQTKPTGGHGPFPTASSAAVITSYQPGGYHIRVTQPIGWTAVGIPPQIKSTVPYVEVSAVAVDAQRGAGFGPWLWQDTSNGLGFAVTANGDEQLIQELGGQMRTLATRSGLKWADGQELSLNLGFDVERQEVTAWVDSTRGHLEYPEGDISAGTASRVTGLHRGGLQVHAPVGTTPTEWSVTEFSLDG
jgi:hypothetical protein